MRNTGLNETQAGLKITVRNINNLRYVGHTILTAERENPKSLFMKLKRKEKKLA